MITREGAQLGILTFFTAVGIALIVLKMDHSAEIFTMFSGALLMRMQINKRPDELDYTGDNTTTLKSTITNLKSGSSVVLPNPLSIVPPGPVENKEKV